MALKSDGNTYTKPELRDKIKSQVTKGDKGGNPGQWSARKAQLVTQEYEKEGGSYKKPRNAAQQSLKKWGDEKWSTATGSAKAREGGKTRRYLPQEAWDTLSPAEKEKTDRKKVEGSQHGQQYVANTAAASTARKQASGGKPGRNAVKTAGKKTVAKKTARKAPAKRTIAKKTLATKASPKKAQSR